MCHEWRKGEASLKINHQPALNAKAVCITNDSVSKDLKRKEQRLRKKRKKRD